MELYSYHLWWPVSALALLALAAWIGTISGSGVLGVLVDGRGRYSLTHFQTVLWTIVILSSLIGLLISRGFDPAALQVPPELLGLMGISSGSAVFATAAKAAAEASRPASIARVGRFAPVGGTVRNIQARFAQIWLEEEGDLADKVVNITKFQSFVFTLVILSVYVTMSWKANALPQLPDNIVWLVGISHAGYVGGKIPAKQ